MPDDVVTAAPASAASDVSLVVGEPSSSGGVVSSPVPGADVVSAVVDGGGAVSDVVGGAVEVVPPLPASVVEELLVAGGGVLPVDGAGLAGGDVVLGPSVTRGLVAGPGVEVAGVPADG